MCWVKGVWDQSIFLDNTLQKAKSPCLVQGEFYFSDGPIFEKSPKNVY